MISHLEDAKPKVRGATSIPLEIGKSWFVWGTGQVILFQYVAYTFD